MSTAGFFMGGMLGRIAGPIAQDWFRYKTKLGREIALHEEEAKKRMSQFDLENKLTLSAQSHKEKLEELEKQYNDSRKRAEEQLYISREDWQQKLFWEKCFPLRNPYELPLGYEPVFDENRIRVEGCCKLSTIALPNNKQIVPLRIITALKDNSHPSASSLNGNLSMFLINNYAANGNHAVVSDIGSWKDEAPINDASINYLFKGAKGLPTMVIMPVFTDNGSTVRLKVWSWGLGEELNYPIGFDFGWFNLDAIKRQVLYSEIKNFRDLLDKTGLSLPPEQRKLTTDIKKLSLFEKYETKINEDDFDNLLGLFEFPDEIKTNVDRKTNEIISSIFSCLAGMHADSYHLSQYGTLPILPSLFGELKGGKFMFPFVRDYYIALTNAKLIEGVITPMEAIGLIFTLGDQAKTLRFPVSEITPLVDNLDFLLKKSEKADGIREQYRSLLQRKSELLNYDESNHKSIEL